jgi:membrane protein YqaA with SNARE-associated domain
VVPGGRSFTYVAADRNGCITGGMVNYAMGIDVAVRGQTT